MRSQTFELDLESGIQSHLQDLSRAGVLFYNAALQERREHPGVLNRTRQMPHTGTICTSAGINPLPYTVMYQLLLELDVATFTDAKFAERAPDHFHPLTWTSAGIEVAGNGILLQPDVQLPTPDFRDPSGILTRVRVMTIIDDITIVNFRWRSIPVHAGPGYDLKRAFGYKRISDGISGYIENLIISSGCLV